MCGARPRIVASLCANKTPLLQRSVGQSRHSHATDARSRSMSSLLIARAAGRGSRAIGARRRVEPVEEPVNRLPLDRVDENREMAGLRDVRGTAVAHELGQALPDGVVIRNAQQRAPHVVGAWQVLIGGGRGVTSNHACRRHGLGAGASLKRS